MAPLPNLSTSVPEKIDFSMPNNATTAFALFNTDFLGYDLFSLSPSSNLALALMIQSLHIISPKFDTAVQGSIQSLIRDFKTAFDIIQLEEKLTTHALTLQDFNSGKETIIEILQNKLINGEALFLASGWAGSPAGHHISLEMIPITIEDKPMVSGRIINRGAGLNYHAQTLRHRKKLTC